MEKKSWQCINQFIKEFSSLINSIHRFHKKYLQKKLMNSRPWILLFILRISFSLAKIRPLSITLARQWKYERSLTMKILKQKCIINYLTFKVIFRKRLAFNLCNGNQNCSFHCNYYANMFLYDCVIHFTAPNV